MSLVPRKPPRGLPVNASDESADGDVENCRASGATPTKAQYNATDTFERIRRGFRELVIEKKKARFSGSEAIRYLLEHLEATKEDYPGRVLGFDNAFKLLQRLFWCRVLRAVDGSTQFQDGDKKIYELAPDGDFWIGGLLQAQTANPPQAQPQLEDATMHPSFTTPSKRNRSASPPRTKRANSIKRLLQVFGRSRTVNDDVGSTSSMHNLTITSDNRVTTADAQVYKASLQRLLLIIDLQDLDGIANPNETEHDDDHSDQVGFLTSILSRMGLSSARAIREHRSLFASEETDDCISSNLISSRYLVGFFNSARLIVPSIHLTRELRNNPMEECSQWARQCLTAIRKYLANLTHEGRAPLIPVEFTETCRAIVEQILMDDRRWKHEKAALQCLFYMIPPAMRKQMKAVIQWLASARNTRVHCVIGAVNDQFERTSGNVTFCDNAECVMRELAVYLAPVQLGERYQHMIIKAFVALFNERGMEEMPKDIAEIVRREETAGLEDTSTVRFAAKPSESVEDSTERALVSMMHDLLGSSALTAAEKHKRLRDFATNHPDYHSRHFADHPSNIPPEKRPRSRSVTRRTFR
ncbi:unnamed protein product, partial [Mesorhabditis spiculigera]